MLTISLSCSSATTRYMLKKLPEIEELMSGAECGAPYDSAKEHYILDIEDRELTAKAVEILERITPVPKKKAKKK